MKNNTITFTVRANNGESVNGFYSRKTDKINLMLPNSGKLYEVHIVGASQPCPHRIYLLDGDEVTVNFNDSTVPATWHVLVDVGHELYQNIISMGNRGDRFNRTPDTVFMDLARAFRKDLGTLVARVENVKLTRSEWEFLNEALSEGNDLRMTQPYVTGDSLAIAVKEGESVAIWLYRLMDDFPRKYTMGDCGFIVQENVVHNGRLVMIKEAMKTALVNLTTVVLVVNSTF